MKTLPIITIVVCAAAVAPAQEPKAAGTAQPDSGIPATRFISGDLDAHVLKLRQRLAINQKERGPFGLYQVPGQTPIIKSPISKMLQKTPFSDYIEQIRITMVNAGDKEFFVNARVFRLGQQFPIVSGGERLTVRVESVEPSKVTFRNLKTGEVATKALALMPAGVTANADLKVRGVTPNRSGEALPLHLDSAPPTPER